MTIPGMEKTGAPTPVQSEEEGPTMTLVPINLDSTVADFRAESNPEFDIDLHLLAAITRSSVDHVRALGQYVKATDLELPTDRAIYTAARTIAMRGPKPEPVELHGYLAGEGLFGGPAGDRIKSRMLAVASCTADPLRLLTFALNVIEESMQRAMLSVAEGLVQAAQELPAADRMPYMVEGGKRLRDIDDRRLILLDRMGRGDAA